MNLVLPIHHIGVACKDLEAERIIFENLDFCKEAEFIDEKQGVKGEFLLPLNTAFPQYRFELVANLVSGGGIIT